MSARIDYDTYVDYWSRHVQWRYPIDKPSNAYVATTGGFNGARTLGFTEMHPALATAVFERLTALLPHIVDEEHTKLLAEYKRAAISEAKCTLAELDKPTQPEAP